MFLSKQGALAIAAYEACYLYAYPDPGTGGRPWTIGVGHTRAAGLPQVYKGMSITLEDAFDIFHNDIKRVCDDVMKIINAPLKQHEFDALVSFHYNTGALRTGTVDYHINHGNRTKAMATLKLYVNAGGQKLKGLVIRREKEARMFTAGDYGDNKPLLYIKPGVKPEVLNDIPWR